MIIPIPTDNTPANTDADGQLTHDYIRWRINVPPWKCPKCGCVVFGRAKYCGYCKMQLNTHTARPDWYVEDEVYWGDR